MRIKPAKPASGLAIRNAFQYAAMELSIGAQHSPSLGKPGGEMCFEFSEGSTSPTVRPMDSVFFKNTFGRSVCFSLAPLWDATLYDEFEIIAANIDPEREFEELSSFRTDLTHLVALMNKRLGLWAKDHSMVAV